MRIIPYQNQIASVRAEKIYRLKSIDFFDSEREFRNWTAPMPPRRRVQRSNGVVEWAEWFYGRGRICHRPMRWGILLWSSDLLWDL